jgi:hypothetical protein
MKTIIPDNLFPVLVILRLSMTRECRHILRQIRQHRFEPYKTIAERVGSVTEHQVGLLPMRLGTIVVSQFGNHSSLLLQ